MARILRRALAPSSTAIATATVTVETIATKQEGTVTVPATESSTITNSIPAKIDESLEQSSDSDAYFLPLQDVVDNYFNDKIIDDNNVSSNSMYAFKTTTASTPSTTTIIGSKNYVPYSASPASDVYNKTIQAQLLEAERARIRAEFFATYDVMTGVRIAATLGGFFGLMVFLIVWKSRSSSNETMKVLKDPKMAAVAAVCMQEEEEREIQEAMVATGMSIYPDEYDAILYRRQRMLSLGNVSAPPMLNRSFRFSSVGGGGYSSLLEPPRRFSLSSTTGAMSIGDGSYTASRRRSVSETSRIFNNYHMGSSFGTDDYFMETEDELENEILDHADHAMASSVSDAGDKYHLQRTDSIKSKQGFLQVPLTGPDSRRSSAMTCCSTDSSYLERRYSAYTLGMRNLPPTLQRKPSTVSRASSTDHWDYYYPDIQVIQATPKSSPHPSEGSIYEKVMSSTQAQTQGIRTTIQYKNGGGARHDRKDLTLTTPITTPIPTTTTIEDSKSFNPSQPSTIHSSVASVIQMRPIDPTNGTRKPSPAYYDIENAQFECKKPMHSLGVDAEDVYPYNQPLSERGIYESPYTVTKAVNAHQNGQMKKELLSSGEVRRKIGVVEPPHMSFAEEASTMGAMNVTNYDSNNTYSISHKLTTNSSSISIDSSPLSIDKLNGSGSLGTISARALFTANRRAPLASLSSFRISSLEYQDSEMRSLDEDSAFLESVADTDEDMEQLSSDSEEVNLNDSQNRNHERDGQKMDERIHMPKSLDESNSSFDLAAHSHLGPAKSAIDDSIMKQSKVATIGTSSKVASSEYSTASACARRALLQRHRTISVSSSDRVTLLDQQLKEFPNSGTQTSTSSIESRAPKETCFSNVIATNNLLRQCGQLVQQYSDSYSQPTSTTTADEETGSVHELNTELSAAILMQTAGTTEQLSATQDGLQARDITTTSSNETPITSTEGRTSASLTQYSSLTTVVSFGRISPLVGSDYDIGNSEKSMTTSDAHHDAHQSSLIYEQQHQKQEQQQQQQQIKQQPKKLPLSQKTDDHCASSVSDSYIMRHHLITDKPSSIYPSTTTSAAFSRSAINLSNIKETSTRCTLSRDHYDPHSPYDSHSIVLELPVINLPKDDNTSNSSDNSLPSGYNIKMKHTKNKSDDTTDNTAAQYASLPGSSRKLSRETLF